MIGPRKNNETVYTERHKPILTEKVYKHHYYSHIPGYYKETPDSPWVKGNVFVLAEQMPPYTTPPLYGRYEKVLDQLAIMKNAVLPSASFEHDEEKSSPLFKAYMVYIPYIEAENLQLRGQFLWTSTKLIIHGNIGRLTIDSTDEPESDILKDLWVYGELQKYDAPGVLIDNVRLPDTTETITSVNTTNIYGLNNILKKNGNSSVRMFDANEVRIPDDFER